MRAETGGISAGKNRRHDACSHCVFLKQYVIRNAEYQLDNFILDAKRRMAAKNRQ